MILFVFFAAIAAATSVEAPSRYESCVALLDADLEAGRREAQQWVGAGGGANARHCLALADLKAGYPKLAAARLDSIAHRKDAGDDFVRARILEQAAEAWLQAGALSYAEKSIAEAIALVPDSGELQLTAAQVYAARERWQEVIDAVTAAEDAGFVSAATYILRGRGYFSFGNYETAAQDVVNALSIEPTNIDALTLRGELQQTGIVIDVSYAAPGNQD